MKRVTDYTLTTLLFNAQLSGCTVTCMDYLPQLYPSELGSSFIPIQNRSVSKVWTREERGMPDVFGQVDAKQQNTKWDKGLIF